MPPSRLNRLFDERASVSDFFVSFMKGGNAVEQVAYQYMAAHVALSNARSNEGQRGDLVIVDTNRFVSRAPFAMTASETILRIVGTFGLNSMPRDDGANETTPWGVPQVSGKCELVSTPGENLRRFGDMSGSFEGVFKLSRNNFDSVVAGVIPAEELAGFDRAAAGAEGPARTPLGRLLIQEVTLRSLAATASR